MGVRPDDEGDLAIEGPAHGDLLAGGLGVESPRLTHLYAVHLCAFRREISASSEGQRIFQRRAHEGSRPIALMHRDLPFCGLQDDRARPRRIDKINGPQQTGLGREVVEDLALIPDVVPRRDDGSAGTEQDRCRSSG